MLAFLKLAVFLALALTVVFWSVSAYSRSVRRERLEDEWDADPKGDAEAREAFIEAGMRDYEDGLRRRLIWLVYIIPTLLILALIYLTNYS